MQMSVNLVGVLSQTLIKTADREGRVAAFETLEAIPAIRNLIREGKTHQIASMIQTGQRRGMYTLDQSLAEIVARGIGDYESAREKCVDPAAFEEMIQRRREDLSAKGVGVRGYDQGYKHVAEVADGQT